jgi:hypothetical protein
MMPDPQPPTPGANDGYIMRAFIKAVILYVLFNGLYLIVQPVQNGLLPTVYNSLIPGRTRFEGAAEFNLHRLLDDHMIRQATAETYNIVFLGSSENWGNRSAPDIAPPFVLDGYHFTNADGRPVRIYNLALPLPDAFKDLMLAQFLYEQHIPIDLIIVPYNYFSFAWPKIHGMVNYNPTYARYIVDLYHLDSSVLLPQHTEAEGSLWGDRETLRRWLIGQALSPEWLLIQRDSDRERMPPMTALEDLTTPEPITRPGIIPALATFHETTHIPLLLMAMPAPLRKNAFRDWLIGQSAESQLPLLDCSQTFTDPAAFEDKMHIMPETQVPFAHVLAHIFSEGTLSVVASGMPLHATTAIEPQEGTCVFHPSPAS